MVLFAARSKVLDGGPSPAMTRWAGERYYRGKTGAAARFYRRLIDVAQARWDEWE